MALCAGIGGLELGLHIAEPGSRPVVFVEQDAFCRTVLASRWPGVPIWDDVLTFDGRPWSGCIDVVTGGFPCQPWSLAGERKGIQDQRWIFPQIADIIRDVGPSYVFLENVPALITGGGLAHVLGALSDLRFDAVWGVYSCSQLGASHQRRRVFVLAYSQSLQCGQGRTAQRERSGRSVRSCEGVADPLRQHLGGESIGGARGSIPTQPQQYQPALANTDRHGRDRLAQLHGRDAALDGPGQTMANGHGASGHGPLWERQSETGRRSEELADGDGSRLAQRQEQYHEQLPAAFRGGREIWAPGPDCDWDTIPREFWPAEHPVCGVADGIPGGMDLSKRVWADAALTLNRSPRLRSLGNAVSPPACAAAWVDLKERMICALTDV